MIISPHAQHTPEWLQARLGVVTASEADNLLTPELKPKTGEAVTTYLAKKLAEWWTGTIETDVQSFWMQQGNILEEQAIPFYEFSTGETIQRVGLITTDDGTCGASPDGLLGEDGGIELKCPKSETHVRYLLAGVLPKDYRPQVHFSMYVTGRKWWKFMSYRRGMPEFILTVQRDDGAWSNVQLAVLNFLTQFKAGKERLMELNGGPPKRLQTKPAPVVKAESEYLDIIP